MSYDNTNKGALWNKTAKSGLLYKAGTINVEGTEFNISVFDNNKQGNDKRPDFNIKIEKKEAQDNKNNDLSVEDIPF